MKYVLYKTASGYALTTAENHNARVQNAHQITHFKTANGYKTAADCLETIRDYFSIDPKQIQIL